MSKRVHFAPTSLVFAPASPTPSPALSVSSLPSSSSSEITTPPPEFSDEVKPYIYPRTPYSIHRELSPEIIEAKEIDIQIHYLLAFSPHADPALFYDLYNRPSLENQTPAAMLAEPATLPPLPSLIVTHPLLDFSIHVLPSSRRPGACVLVYDVFEAVYEELRLQISPMEYARLGHDRPAVDAAYFKRCARIRGEISESRSLEERKKGIRKIDLLMGNTRFMGLTGTLSGPDIWELNVS